VGHDGPRHTRVADLRVPEKRHPGIIEQIKKLMAEELSSRALCNQMTLRSTEVVYEVLSASSCSEVERVFAFLGIEAQYRPPRSVKLSRDCHREAKKRTLEEIRAFVE
jgi:hypothetical protein